MNWVIQACVIYGVSLYLHRNFILSLPLTVSVLKFSPWIILHDDRCRSRYDLRFECQMTENMPTLAEGKSRQSRALNPLLWYLQYQQGDRLCSTNSWKLYVCSSTTEMSLRLIRWASCHTCITELGHWNWTGPSESYDKKSPSEFTSVFSFPQHVC